MASLSLVVYARINRSPSRKGASLLTSPLFWVQLTSDFSRGLINRRLFLCRFVVRTGGVLDRSRHRPGRSGQAMDWLSHLGVMMRTSHAQIRSLSNHTDQITVQITQTGPLHGPASPVQISTGPIYRV